ncbi:hypothetical protein [Streptomyces werraensis]|uniref:hypothetical protein n=1 Tax=Streptomyces werraensis TaxID=68284 RepID=UPI003676EFEE
MSDLPRKMFLAETAAVREHLAEQEQQATAKAEAALAPLKVKARELEARRLAEHRAAVLREAADRIDNEELPHDYVDMFDNGARWAAKLLRRMADETATETPAAAYSDGNGPAYCIGCTPAVGADVPLTADDVGPSDRCRSCGRHVVDVAAAGARQGEPPQPSLRDQHRAAWAALTPDQQTARLAELDNDQQDGAQP